MRDKAILFFPIKLIYAHIYLIFCNQEVFPKGGILMAKVNKLLSTGFRFVRIRNESLSLKIIFINPVNLIIIINQ